MLKRNKPLKRTSCLKKTCTLKATKSLNKQSSKAKEAWQIAREKCLKRDNYKCIICGRIATQVHHIHLRSKRHDLLYNLNNLVSLCDRCHFHQGSLRYKEQTEIIARKLNLTVEELFKYAEQ